MTPTVRQRLEDLATQLHLRHEDAAPAAAAHADVEAALGNDDAVHGLGDRLEMFAVELETEHPTLTSMIRAVVVDLHALGV